MACFLLCIPTLVYGATEIFGYPSGTNGVMSVENSPYVVSSDIVVPTGGELVIEAGVVVKMKNGVSIVAANTNAKVTIGTSSPQALPVVITGYADDIYGGDTNGGATAPNAGDWGRIQLSGSTAEVSLDNTIVRYGGGSGGAMLTLGNGAIGNIASTTWEYSATYAIAIAQDATQLTIASSTIQHNIDGIGISSQANATITNTAFTQNRRGIAIDTNADVSNLVIDNNSFVDNTLVTGSDPFAGVHFSDADDVLDLSNNWWGDNSGPTHSSNPSGTGDVVIGNVDLGEWTVSRIPVILVPGIMGTELWKGDEKIWLDGVNVIEDVGDDFLNILAMGFDGSAADNSITVGDIIRNEPTTNIFKGLIEAFYNSGYQENVHLFVFPYDWRLDIRDSSDKLNEKINLVINNTGISKVNIIAHSMGGLLSKNYILDYGSEKVNKMIFVGTPHLGSPKAAKALLFGDSLIALPGLSSSRIQYIVQNMLSVYQLLPTSSYLDQNYYLYDITNPKIFDYNYTKEYLINNGLSKLLIENAEDFHSPQMDNFDTSAIDAYNINGCNNPTITSITKRGEDDYMLAMFEGDGTVPLISSMALNVDNSKQFYFKNQGYLNNLFPRISHATMPSDGGIKELIISIITGTSIILPEYATQNSSECFISGKLVSVHSPVNLHIYDANNNHVGRGENGAIDYNISGVAYEEIGENKFVFLPETNGENYRVELDGTGEGTFSLRVSKVSNDQITETAYYSDLPVSNVSEATITLATSTADTILSLDTNGSGLFEEVSINSVLDATASADITKPQTAISFSGNESSSNTFQFSTTITLSASDDNAGVLKTEYSLDNGSTWINYTNAFILNTLGTNTVLYKSTDRAGNKETIKTTEVTIIGAGSAIATAPQVKTILQDENTFIEKEIEFIEPHVLGESTIREDTQKIYTQSEILGALENEDIHVLLSYLGVERSSEKETQAQEKYKELFTDNTHGINFVVYGTKSTLKLGEGERAGVLYSYKQAFGRLPKSQKDWRDLLHIANGEMPETRSERAELSAREIYNEIYGNIGDEHSIMTIAYGFIPKERSIEKEQIGIIEFIKKLNRIPVTTQDWNILKSIVY